MASERGFVLIGAAIVLFLAVLVVGTFVFVSGRGTSERRVSEVAQEDGNEPPLKLKSLGIELSDIVFMEDEISLNRVFIEYGFEVPSSMSEGGEGKVLHQPAFIAPLGTKVHSLVDGEVVEVKEIWSGDYTVMVAKGGGKNTRWIYETEHVINPVVKVGDIVKAGQVVAEVSDFDTRNYAGYGLVEIGILEGGAQPLHHCPFLYLDESVKEEYYEQLTTLMARWEEFKGDSSIYNEDSFVVPGCITLETIGE